MLSKSKIKQKNPQTFFLKIDNLKIKTKYEYFNTLSKHFGGCKNPFF